MIRRAIDVEGKTLEISNINKVFWPEKGYTKGDLLRYYSEVSRWILPYLKDRPVVMKRYPDGIYGKTFYQKRCPDYAPEWLENAEILGEKEKIKYCLCNDLASLLWFVNQGCIEMHTWLSKVATPDLPDIMTLDLDPYPGVPFSQVLEVSLLIKKYLDMLGLKSFPKTSGATGIHIFVPILNKYSYKDVRKIAYIVARMVTADSPKLATVERKVHLRTGKVYVDYLQNANGKSMAVAYSVRARPSATVSTPLTWKEIDSGNISPEMFTIENILDRLYYNGDIMEPVLKGGFSLDEILKEIKNGNM